MLLVRSILPVVSMVCLLAGCDALPPADVAPTAPSDTPVAAPNDLGPDSNPDASLHDGVEPLGSQYTYTLTMPAGHTQQVPDQGMKGAPVPPIQAMAEALAVIAQLRAAVPEPVVIAAGFDHHGVPAEPESTNPDDVPAGTPHLVLDFEATRGPIQSWHICKEIVMDCAVRSGTVDACMDLMPRCATETPWEEAGECCPTPCATEYTDRRKAGADAETAWFDTFEVDIPSCFAPIREIARLAAELNTGAPMTTPDGGGTP